MLNPCPIKWENIQSKPAEHSLRDYAITSNPRPHIKSDVTRFKAEIVFTICKSDLQLI